MALEDRLQQNCTIPGEEVISVYPTEELASRLRGYNSPDAAIIVDVAGCVRESPEQAIVLKNLLKPWRWIRHPEWLFDLAYIFPTAVCRGWNVEQMELFSIYYADTYVMPHFSVPFLEQIAREESPPLFPGVQQVVNSFNSGRKVILSRGFVETTSVTAQELGIGEHYHHVLDKSSSVVDYARQRDVKKILLFGDLMVDEYAGIAIREAGYDTDIVLVKKDIHRDRLNDGGTIFIPRNWLGLYKVMKGEP